MPNEFDPCFDIRKVRIAKALGCTPSLVQEIWDKLEIDLLEDPNDLGVIRETVKIYESASKLTDRLLKTLDTIPADECDRLIVERSDVLKKTKEINEELHKLLSHRVSIINRNPNTGGSDVKADALAELVALIYEASNRKVTFGQFENNPTTNFCKSVMEVLSICETKRYQSVHKDYISNWRQPARKAFKRRNS